MQLNELIIFAGGFGSRLNEETTTIPKPLIEIGGNPILWHIMKIYESYGFSNFNIALGYKGNLIKEYFLKYKYFSNSININFKDSSINFITKKNEKWNINLIDTGLTTLTTQRLKRSIRYIKNDDFCLTYGDAVSNVNINRLIKSHINSKKILTITAVKSPPRFGKIKLKENKIISFKEKKIDKGDLINGGFFVVNKKIINYLNNKDPFEKTTMDNLLKNNQINIYQHNGFWRCMDTLSDKKILEEIWQKKKPWKNW